MRLRVDEVVPAGPGAPVLLNFQNGYVTEAFSGADTRAAVLCGEDGGTVVAAEVGGALYVGQQEEAELGQTLLLARNRRTGKVRVLQAGWASMRAAVRAAPSLADPESAGAGTLELSRKFGSKREKQKTEQREKLKVNTQTMTSQLKSVAEDSDAVNKIDLKTYSKTDSDDFYIPPINREADNVRDVYDISTILSQDQVEKITSEIESKDFTAELMPYIKGFTVRKKSWNETERALFLYANSLLKLYSTMVKDMTKKSFAVCETSPTINEICLANFVLTIEGKRTRPNQYKDKALCHLIVLLLLLSELRFELAPFSSAVRAAVATVATKARAVGAYVSADKKHVLLKLPLNSAKSFISRRKSAKF